MSPVGDHSPNADERYSTIKDEIWYLETYTTDEWAVEGAGFPETNHGGQVCLQASLSHEAGHSIECTPIDPWASSPGPDLLRAHRILLEDVVRDAGRYIAFGEVPQRREDRERVYTQPARRVASTDEIVEGSAMGKGTNVSTLSEARACIIAAARSISKRYQKRSQWFGTTEEPEEITP